MAEAKRLVPDRVDSVAPAHVLILEARFYESIGQGLFDGATAALTAAGATFDTLALPGALEMPLAMAIAADAAAAAGKPYDAAVVLGCVIRGETYHFEIVANDSCRGVMQVSLDRKLPLGNGILTVENEEQAEYRADPARGDKGGDAARAALALLRIKRRLEVR